MRICLFPPSQFRNPPPRLQLYGQPTPRFFTFMFTSRYRCKISAFFILSPYRIYSCFLIFILQFLVACMYQEITGCAIHYIDQSFTLLYSASPFVTAHIFLGTFLPSKCHLCSVIIESDYIPHLS